MVTVAEKYRYLCDREELESWTPRVLAAAGKARETHVVFNNRSRNYGSTNALEMHALIVNHDGRNSVVNRR